MTKSFDSLVEQLQTGWSPERWEQYRSIENVFFSLVHEEEQARKAMGQSLANARKTLELSQKELADRTAINQADISKIERGASNPTATTMVRLAGALGLHWTLEPKK